MPLEAVVGGLPVAAAHFTAANWDVLQALIRDSKVTVELPYCGCRGHGAVSVIDTQYFKHYSDSTDCEYATAGESAEHLFAKQQIAAGIRAAGWAATIEQSQTPGAYSRWRADVMATRDGHRTAFEVQRSQQTAIAYLQRHTRYATDGVDAVWFVINDRRLVTRLSDRLPAFHLSVAYGEAAVLELGAARDEQKPLAKFVRDWLMGERPAQLQAIAKSHEAERAALERDRARSFHPLKPVPARPRAPITHLKEKTCPACGDPNMTLSKILNGWYCLKCYRREPPTDD